MTKFYKFTVKGTEFKCFTNPPMLRDDYGTVSIKSGGFWCDRTIRCDENDKLFFTWNGKVVFIDDLVETNF